jgi:secreted trypsin-like serine protease
LFDVVGGQKGKDACIGDGGSSLVCPMPNMKNLYYQAGIVVGGIGCGLKDVPGLYANVFKYLPWIKHENFLRGYEL